MYKVFGCLLFVLHLFPLLAQQPLPDELPEKYYNEGMIHFREGAYKISSEMLQTYQRASGLKMHVVEADFYTALAQLKAGDKHGIDGLKDFTTNYSNHPLASLANYNLGNDAFERKEYAQALGFYKLVSKDQLDKESLISFLFKRGYCYMIAGDNKQAVNDLKQVSYYKKQYFEESVYYSGLIFTKEKNYSEALSILEDGDTGEGPYAELIKELLANIYYQTEQYDKLISYSVQNMTESASQTNRTFHRLLGETYFKKQEYRTAAKHFQRNLDLSKSKMDADGYYKLGYSYYQIKADDKAIDNFKFAALEKGNLGQNSSFYLGKLYLKASNYSYALSAFKNAISEGDNLDMREEASFLVGKINYSSDQYSEAITTLTAFKQNYPTSKWSVEASELLTKAFLKTSNYEQAITYIESTKTKTPVIQKAYQSVCFLKAQQLFNDSKFAESIDFFNKSLTYKSDIKIASQSYFLLGEAYSLTNNAAAAKTAYNNCRSLTRNTVWASQASYGLGYLAYNQKQFEEAETHFKSFVSESNASSRYFADASLRLADCYFVQKKQEQAIRTYQPLLRDASAPQDYINYQLGIIYALTGEREKARNSFSSVITYAGKSAYKDNAFFQTGESFMNEGAFMKAVDNYTQLIANFPESVLVPFSYSRRALCYANLSQNPAAKKDYEFILKEYISHEVANNALLGLQELIKRGVDVPDFDNHMEAFRSANPDDSSLEVVAFEAAKSKYYNQNYKDAIPALNAFASKYPLSSFVLDVNYFVADSYYRLSDWQNAADKFALLTAGENNAYKTRSLDKRGKSLLTLNKFNEALKNYRALLTISTNRKEQFTAREGLMNAHFKLNNGDSALYFTDLILSDEWKPVGVEEGIWLLKGKVLLANKSYGAATDEFIKVINGPLDEQSAEAKYYLAQVLYLQGSYNRSLETLFDLNRNYGSYAYWIGKSFLLIADNYVALKELLQAKATLNSVITNSPVKEIVDLAKTKLAAVEKAEKEVLIKESVTADTLNTGK